MAVPDIRKAKIAKIKIASKSLALEDDSYRALLMRVTGKDSCAAMTASQLDAVLEEFKGLGFKAKKKRAGARKQADSAQAAKIRALWIMLYQMGATIDSSEHALSLFAKRSCGVEDLQWIDSGHADKIIRALRGWMERLGYVHPTADLIKAIGSIRSDNNIDQYWCADVIAAKLNLIHYQIRKVPAPSPFHTKTMVCGHEIKNLHLLCSAEMDLIIESLGVLIRR